MKDALPVTIDQCLDHLHEFDAILDARSPAEYALDHLPGATNAAVLDDAQRAQVGTLYKASPFEARKVGAALVANNIANLLQTTLAHQPREWRPLVYCWRGGNRSGALATILARVGWRTSVLQGGYREYRRRVVSDLAELPRTLRFVVLAGRTGSGKSLILASLRALGAQVLDLETLAAHRGSVLGRMPERAQPSQKHFESLIWSQLRSLDPARPVFVESESKRVGLRQVPDALIERMRASDCARIEADDNVRADLLLEEYRHYTTDPVALLAQLDHLVSLHGRERIANWRTMVGAAQWREFVLAMLHEHYDPAYDRSMQRNFAHITTAEPFRLLHASGEAAGQTARQLIDRYP